MASRGRGRASRVPGSRKSGPQQTDRDVPELNCVPPPHPVNPATSSGKTKSSALSAENNSGPCSGELPAMVFLTSHPTTKEWNTIITASRGVALTGSAAKATAGPAIGSVDIGQSKDEYLFRVSLPGVARNDNDFSCYLEPDGEVKIQGRTVAGGETVRKCSMVFQMQTQNLSPPGEFSISFRLPGPIDTMLPVQCRFGPDGVLEAIARKKIGQ